MSARVGSPSNQVAFRAHGRYWEVVIEILASRLLAPFPHGFTTRQGGVSAGPFESLNLGGSVGDVPDAVATNWSRLREATGLVFARVRQVHGYGVVRARRNNDLTVEADALLSGPGDPAACVSVADCVPVLLADPRTGSVAAVHAGWRGTLARASAQAVAALQRELGVRARDLVAAIGPSIGPCCYEVSAEVAERFRLELGREVVLSSASGSTHIDLWRANEEILKGAGLHPERIELLGRCTSCERALFFSHRRDAGRTGRQVGFIAPAPSPLP
jgi:YfiH family protein